MQLPKNVQKLILTKVVVITFFLWALQLDLLQQSFKSLSRLKRGKKDGMSVYSNHLSLASVILAPYLSSLFTSMLRHGYIPSTLLDCVLKPLPKPGKDLRLSDSYRPIALASTLSKFFEWCILLQFNDAFISSDLQFGFKQGLSTDLCTGLIKNVIARYNSSGSHVLGCFLDASKAFDRVNHYVLFKKLLNRKLSPIVVRLLLYWYRHQSVRVDWNGSLSEGFEVRSGVRQGGVLSPLLFAVYLDDLFKDLEQLGVGCYWRHHYAGAIGYADDIALLAPSASALRMMLNVCQNFASSHSLTFNPDKTQLICFACTKLHPISYSISFCGKTLSLTRSVKHLGHILSSDLSDNLDIIEKTKDMVRKANYMLQMFSCCDKLTKTTLFRSYCLALPGCSLWSLASPQLSSLVVAFNNILRKIWSLPRRCHTSFVQLVAGLESPLNSIYSRSTRLLRKAVFSSSKFLRDIFYECSLSVQSSLGYNIRYGYRDFKSYLPQDCLFANFLRDVVLSPSLNYEILNELLELCCV